MASGCFCHLFGRDVCRHSPVPDVITRAEKRRLRNTPGGIGTLSASDVNAEEFYLPSPVEDQTADPFDR